MKLLERAIGQETFAAGQTRSISLPRNYAFRALSLKLVCDLTRTTTAGTSSELPKDSAPAQLIQSIMIRANGRDVIKYYDLETLHRMCQFRHSVRPHISSTGWIGGDDAADVEMSIHAIIDFEMWRAIRPIDSLLQSAGLSTLELVVTFGQGIDTMSTGWQAETGAAVTVNSATLYVAGIEAVGVPQDTRFIINKEFQIQSIINAASTNHQIQLPVGNRYRSILIKTTSDSLNVDTILNNIKIQSGTEVYKNVNAFQLQMENRLDYGLEIPRTNQTVDRQYTEGVMVGYHLLEFCRDGRLTECLETERLSSLDLVLDVNAPGTTDIIDIYPVELIRPAA